jgi:hypothetical protein
MCKKLAVLTFLVLALVTVSIQAAVTPITNITYTRVEAGAAPKLLLESITVGSYTIAVNRLVTGTSEGVATAQPAPYNDIKNADSFDLNLFAGRSNENPPTHKVTQLGGKSAWVDTNGNNPDFFIFETGGNQDINVEAILPGGAIGRSVAVPTAMWGDTGLDITGTPHNGQSVSGIALAITDLFDQNGNRLTNSSIIAGIQISSAGYDPSLVCAVLAGQILEATSPSPADGAISMETWITLGWTPGDTAVSHDIYVGESFDDVNSGAAGTFRVNQPAPSAMFFIGLGLPGDPYPGGLVPGTTYYWRIDEVEANGATKHKGSVWSFTIPSKKAHDPTPPDGAKFMPTSVTLAWVPGLGAKLHYVYFGDNLETVSNATVGTPAGAATFTPPGPLTKGKTYYWRVDEFDGAATHKGNVWSFTTLPDVPISDPNLVGWWTLDEGQGTIAVDWSGRGKHGAFQGDPLWVDGLDGGALEFDGDDYVDTGNTQDLAKWTIACWVISPAAPASASPSGPLHREKNYQFDWNHTDAVFRGAVAIEIGGTWHAASYMPVAANTWYHLAATLDGTALRAYRDGVLITTNTAASGVPTAETGTLKLGRHATAAQFFTGTVDDARVYSRALSAQEIQAVMRGNLTRAWQPNPANGSTSDVVRAATLNWSRGDKASQHAVYFGTDRNAVVNADTSDTTGVYRGLQSATSYTAPEIAWAGGPYYWRVDEHNTDGTITKGTIWSFSMADYVLVEDFESYNDIATGQPGSNLVYTTWLDGFGTTTNGSTMGYPTGSSLETANVHGGTKTVPLIYNNATASFSEVERTLAAQNWTSHGIQTLSLWFYGDLTNVPGQLYVKINGVKVPYDGDAGNLKKPIWQAWNINLASAGVNLQSVTRLAVGIETKGTTGTLLLDDIRLYRTAPVFAEQIWLEAEAANPLGASWRQYTDPLSSAGRHIGSQDGDGDENNTAPGAAWVARYSFNAAGGTYKVLLRAQEQTSDSLWVRVTTATAQTHEHPGQPGTGWVRFNELDAPSGWAWDEVHSNDHANAVVNWTLPAGQNTLEIAKREDGVLLDAIVIMGVQ